jgi:class 3 adenylate cyclase
MVTGGSTVQPTRRMLATMLFTDIVGSTECASATGDHGWRDLLDRHGSLLREHVADAGGRVVKMIGQGSLSIFDGPARAIGCATEFV